MRIYHDDKPKNNIYSNWVDPNTGINYHLWPFDFEGFSDYDRWSKIRNFQA